MLTRIALLLLTLALPISAQQGTAGSTAKPAAKQASSNCDAKSKDAASCPATGATGGADQCPAAAVIAKDSDCCKEQKAVKVAKDSDCCKEQKAVTVSKQSDCCKEQKAVKVSKDSGCCYDEKAVTVSKQADCCLEKGATSAEECDSACQEEKVAEKTATCPAMDGTTDAAQCPATATVEAGDAGSCHEAKTAKVAKDAGCCDDEKAVTVSKQADCCLEKGATSAEECDSACQDAPNETRIDLTRVAKPLSKVEDIVVIEEVIEIDENGNVRRRSSSVNGDENDGQCCGSCNEEGASSKTSSKRVIQKDGAVFVIETEGGDAGALKWLSKEMPDVATLLPQVVHGSGAHKDMRIEVVVNGKRLKTNTPKPVAGDDVHAEIRRLRSEMKRLRRDLQRLQKSVGKDPGSKKKSKKQAPQN